MANTDDSEDQRAYDGSKYKKNTLPDVSLKLTHILNESGFSESYRAIRVQTSLMSSAVANISLTIGSCMHSGLGMGSFTEGTTTIGMHSDIDTLFFNPFVQAHCSVPKISSLLCVVMIRDKETPLGYVKLRPIEFGHVINNTGEIQLNSLGGLHIFEKFSKDNRGRLVLSNQFQSYTEMDFDGRHGPAESIVGRSDLMDQDFVRSYKCDDIPEEMEPWFDRNRKCDWPSKETRDLFRQMGCFVVPVGHPSSPEKDLEWRISFSLQERHLVWHLNPTQYHCYMLLKLIKKFLIKPQCGDVLSSYQCKTCLFYTIEGLEEWVWIPENIIACLQQCLLRLYKWIDNRYIPNYFIPEENMFVKMETMRREEYKQLKALMMQLCNSWEFLYTILFHDIGHKLQVSVANGIISENSYSTAIEVLDQFLSVNSRDLIRTFKFKGINNLHCSLVIFQVTGILRFLDELLLTLRRKQQKQVYITFAEVARFKYLPFDTAVGFRFPLAMLVGGKSSDLFFVEKYDERKLLTDAVRLIRGNVQIIYASILAARFIQTKRKTLLTDSYMYLELGKSYDAVTSTLTKATILLKRNLHESCNTLLQQTAIMSTKRSFECWCRMPPNISGVNRREHIYHAWAAGACRHRDGFPQLFSTGCLVFGRCTFDIIPQALTYEAYRSFGAPINSRKDFDDDWFDTVVVDPLRYMYYLQYLANKDERQAGAAVALRKLENTVFDKLPNIGEDTHIETGINLLGDIFAKKGWTQLALRCFKYSYKLRPLHNAAKWHVMFLLFCPLGETT